MGAMEHVQFAQMGINLDRNSKNWLAIRIWCLVIVILDTVSSDEPDIDNRYQDILNYLTKSPWRKKEIAVLAAKKSNISERTARDRLKDLEEWGIIETVRISQNRVFVKRNTDHELTFKLDTENKSKVQSLLEETHKLAMSVTETTFPFRSKSDTTSNSMLPGLTSLLSQFKNNTLSPKKLKELEDNVGELDKLCREQFVVIYEDPYVDYIFQIFDHLTFLLKNYDKIENTDELTNWRTLTTDLTPTSKRFISFLNEISLNAMLVGYGESYDSRLSSRISELQPLIENGPDFIRDDIYYLIHSHGDTSEMIDAFTTNIRHQERQDYDEILTDVRSLYTDGERDKLRERLRSIANELDGQQRTIVERLCDDLKHYDKYIQTDDRIRYYNQSKRKIIAILSHGPEKLENIGSYSAESRPNVHSNITSLSEDGYIAKKEGKHGYYRLNQELQKLFEERREKTPESDRKEVKETLDSMASWREEYVYPKGVPIYENEEKLLQRYEQPPWFKLLSFALDRSFVLKREAQLNSFFEILDGDIQKIKTTGEHFLEIPEEISTILYLSKILHEQWRKGLENIHYHSELYKRLDDLKEAHSCAPPSERKNIRSLISTISLDEADDLFKQAVVDKQETIDDLKTSIDDIYYKNNQMHKIVEYLSPEDWNDSAERCGIRQELLEYSVNIPYKNQF